MSWTKAAKIKETINCRYLQAHKCFLKVTLTNYTVSQKVLQLHTYKYIILIFCLGRNIFTMAEAHDFKTFCTITKIFNPENDCIAPL